MFIAVHCCCVSLRLPSVVGSLGTVSDDEFSLVHASSKLLFDCSESCQSSIVEYPSNPCENEIKGKKSKIKIYFIRLEF